MITPDVNYLLDQLHDHFPDVTVGHVKQQSGQFSDVLLIDDRLAFRFLRDTSIREAIEREIGVLHALRGVLPLPIPNPQYVARDDKGDLLFMGYPMLPGTSLMKETFRTIVDEDILQHMAEQLAAFLLALHSQPITEPSTDEGRAWWVKLYADFQEKLYPHMGEQSRQEVSASFEAALSNDDLWDYEPLYCHGDFGIGNILFDGEGISGIIDFTFAGAGDPAQDVGALVAGCGLPFVQRILAIYPALRSTLPRMEFIRSTYALQHALYALNMGDQADFEAVMANYVA